MFHKLVVLVVAAVVVMAGLAAASPASASPVVASSQEQVIYLTKIKPGTNRPCKVGFDKMFRVNLKVPKGKRIKSWGDFSLRVNGHDRLDEGSPVGKRLVEFYYPVGRKAKVARDLAKSYGYVTVSPGATPRAVVERLCNSQET